MSKNLRINFYLLNEFLFVLNKFVINLSIEIVVSILVVHRLSLIDNENFSKNNFNKLITITIFNEKIVIFAYQLQIFFEKNVNFKLISINVQQTIKRVTSIYSRSTKFNENIDDIIDRIKFIEFIESKHVSR